MTMAAPSVPAAILDRTPCSVRAKHGQLGAAASPPGDWRDRAQIPAERPRQVANGGGLQDARAFRRNHVAASSSRRSGTVVR